jgi:hypothetical protein
MSEGQSQRSVTSSAQHRQEAEVATAETAATAARAARLTMAELAVARAEVEAAAAELKALRTNSTDSSVSADDDRDNELKLVREAAREQAAQWAATHPENGDDSPDRSGRTSGWVDGDRGLYRPRGSPSLDMYHGHHGI